MTWRGRLAAAALLPLLVAGCGGDQPEPGRPADTVRYSDRLPSGRFQLPTSHTPAPDLWITLPEGYTVKPTGRLPNDEFYIFGRTDPTLSDPAAISPGFIRVYVGVMPQSARGSRRAEDSSGVHLAGRTLVWYLWSDTLTGGTRFRNAELTSDDFFASISPELARSPLHLHVYVGGSDSARVSELIYAAESIGLTP